jgi:hypothetical protein
VTDTKAAAPDGQRPEDQPLPKPGTGPSMHDLVCADIPKTSVSLWEGGHRDPGVAGLIRLAGVLGVPASSLLEAGPEGGEPS